MRKDHITNRRNNEKKTSNKQNKHNMEKDK